MNKILLGAVMLIGTLVFGGNSNDLQNVYDDSFYDGSEVFAKQFIELYSTGSEIVYTYESEVFISGEKISVKIGFDSENEVSSFKILDVISKSEQERIINLLVKGSCLTNCSRQKGCSDKPTNVGAGICAGECVLDCIFG